MMQKFLFVHPPGSLPNAKHRANDWKDNSRIDLIQGVTWCLFCRALKEFSQYINGEKIVGFLFFFKLRELIHDWLVVSTHLKNIGQNGNLPQIGMKIKNI